MNIELGSSDRFELLALDTKPGVRDMPTNEIGNWSGLLVVRVEGESVFRDVIIMPRAERPPTPVWRRRAIPQIRRYLRAIFDETVNSPTPESWDDLPELDYKLTGTSGLAKDLDTWLASLL